MKSLFTFHGPSVYDPVYKISGSNLSGRSCANGGALQSGQETSFKDGAMGLTHMLIVALTGITYGWQSDGNGGVEYIVQVSPAELEQIDRIGEITSVIDPAVAGHVSQIKIRVGTAAVPRQTPPHLSSAPPRSERSERSERSGARSYDLASDRLAVPIPEMKSQDQAIPIASPGPRSGHDGPRSGHDGPRSGNAIAAGRQPGSQTTAMMKPDPQSGATGPGFSMPTVPDFATRARTTASEAIDQAGRSVTDFSNRTIDQAARNANGAVNSMTNGFNANVNTSGLVPPPSTRQPSTRQPSTRQPNTNLQTPPFANTNPNVNRNGTFASGPSTEPTSQRDQSWNELSRSRTTGPSTTEVGTDRMPFNDPRSRLGANAAANNSGSSSRRTTGAFGQVPNEMSIPNRVNTTATAGQTGILSQQQQMEYDRLRGRTQPTSVASGNRQRTIDPQTGQYNPNANRNPPPIGNDLRTTQNPRFAGPAGSQTNPGQSNFNRSGQPFPTEPVSGPDRRLTQAELAAGAWQIDRYGGLVDRNGRRVTMTTTDNRRATAGTAPGTGPAPAPAPGNRYDYAASPDRFAPNGSDRDPINRNRTEGQPYPYGNGRSFDDRFATNMTTPNVGGGQTPVRGSNPDRGRFVGPPADRAGTIGTPNAPSRSAAEPVSNSDQGRSAAAASGLGNLPKTASKKVAAQPFFNGLLLMSFVANIYLVFWLKNLRLRFRDMVASKRVASAGSQPA